MTNGFVPNPNAPETEPPPEQTGFVFDPQKADEAAGVVGPPTPPTTDVARQAAADLALIGPPPGPQRQVSMYAPPPDVSPAMAGVGPSVDLGGRRLSALSQEFAGLRKQFGPETKEAKDYKAARKAKLEADVGLAQAEHDANAKIAGLREEAQQRGFQIQKRYWNQIQAAQKSVDDQRTRYETAVDEFKAAKTEDPENFWKDKQGKTQWGRKALGAIAMAMGAFASAKTGGPNVAMQVIQGKIRRDIEAQRKAREGKRQAVGAEKDALNTARQLFDDEYRQNRAAYSMELGRHQDIVNAQIEEAKDPIRKAKLEAISKGLHLEAAKVNDEILSKTTQLEMSAIGEEAKIRGVAAKTKMAEFGAGVKQGKPLPGRFTKNFAITDREVFDQLSKTGKDTARKSIISYNKAKGALNELKAWREANPGTSFGGKLSKDAQRGISLAKAAIRELKVYYNMGANFTEMEKQLIDVPEDPGEWAQVMEQIDTQIETVDRNMMAIEDATGLGQIQRQIAKKGVEQPRGY